MLILLSIEKVEKKNIPDAIFKCMFLASFKKHNEEMEAGGTLMTEYEFSHIFADLADVEKQLQNAGENKESRQKCYERLLELRKSMDRYVEFWLRFEEKLNDLQDTYDFVLPDELPEYLLNAFPGILSEETPDTKEAETDKRGLSTLALNVENDCICSFRRGLGFFELAMMDEAVAEFKQTIKLEPDLLLAHLCLGIALAERGNDDEAMRELRLVQALATETRTKAIVHNSLGNIYAEKEQYEQALPEFEKAIENDPDFGIAKFNLGAAYFNIKEYPKSLVAFESVKEQFPSDWEVYFYLGKIYKMTGNYQEALVNLLKSSYLAPRQPFVSFELGLTYDGLGETRKALEYYYRARRLYQEQEVPSSES